MPKPEGLVYKDIIGEIREVKDDGTMVAAISTDAVDRMGEVLDPTGVDLKNYKANPVVLWAHDYERPPIAKAQWVKRDGKVILSKLKFAPTEFAQEIKMLYEQKFMNTFSVGFIPKEWVDGDGDKSPRRKYTSWELLEYSAVPVPANPEALAMAMKKGLIKSAEMKALIKEPPLQEFNHEETNSSDNRANVDVKGVDGNHNDVKKEVPNPLEELISENKGLNEKVVSLEQENTSLRYKLFLSLKQNQESLSEITSKNVVNEIEDVVRRVIRKAQGKID